MWKYTTFRSTAKRHIVELNGNPGLWSCNFWEICSDPDPVWANDGPSSFGEQTILEDKNYLTLCRKCYTFCPFVMGNSERISYCTMQDGTYGMNYAGRSWTCYRLKTSSTLDGKLDGSPVLPTWKKSGTHTTATSSPCDDRMISGTFGCVVALPHKGGARES